MKECEDKKVAYIEPLDYFPKEIRKEYKLGEFAEANDAAMQVSQFDFVNAHINNISFPKTIEELEHYIYEHGCYNVEDVIHESANGYTIWTVPRSSAVGDIVLYFHAKTAIQWIRKLETALKSLDEEEHDVNLLSEWLNKARDLYSLYGGKIFAIGRIISRPEMELPEYDNLHYHGRIFANVSDLFLLDKPIDISEFNSFILVSRQSAITPLPGSEYERLKNIIISKNPRVPQYFLDSKIGDYNLSKINANNFIEITHSYRKRFLLESNFRSYYVDYFLKTLSGRKYYRECQCHSDKNPLARVDNVFEFEGKKILLEVKLNISLEKDLISQLEQYINADYIYLTTEQNDKLTDFERNYMYVIDAYAVYKYTAANRKLTKLFDLDELNHPSDIFVKMR